MVIGSRTWPHSTHFLARGVRNSLPQFSHGGPKSERRCFITSRPAISDAPVSSRYRRMTSRYRVSSSLFNSARLSLTRARFTASEPIRYASVTLAYSPSSSIGTVLLHRQHHADFIEPTPDAVGGMPPAPLLRLTRSLARAFPLDLTFYRASVGQSEPSQQSSPPRTF